MRTRLTGVNDELTEISKEKRDQSMSRKGPKG